MNLPYARDVVTLLVGDLAVFAGSLWLALVARHFVAPNFAQYLEHLIPFAPLFILWMLVFLGVGLYDRTVALFEHRLPGTILQAQLVNTLIAVVFFFALPLPIQPKTILALYFVLSTLLFVVWRMGVFRLRSLGRGNDLAIVVGAGGDIEELGHTLRISPHTTLDCVDIVDTRELDPETVREKVAESLTRTRAKLVIRDPRLTATLTTAHFPGITYIDALEVYEAIFSRTPLSLIDERTFETHTIPTDALHDAVKRLADILLSALLFIVLLVLLPLVWLATRFEGPGNLFIFQERVGKSWRRIRVFKLRTMTQNETASHAWVGESTNRVTKVGAFLRRTSIDELPQLFSVLKGGLSLIGPRSDIWGLGERLREEIPLYHVRYLVTPGISGWAQVNQRYAPGNISPQSIEESRVRLMYDLYYVRHRSILLDLTIVAKTCSTLISRLIP
jgi:lipopolysaccharide/colanic/teichoic acid biosynthesis glycosyltransferase